MIAGTRANHRKTPQGNANTLSVCQTLLCTIEGFCFVFDEKIKHWLVYKCTGICGPNDQCCAERWYVCYWSNITYRKWLNNFDNIWVKSFSASNWWSVISYICVSIYRVIFKRHFQCIYFVNIFCRFIALFEALSQPLKQARIFQSPFSKWKLSFPKLNRTMKRRNGMFWISHVGFLDIKEI